MKTKKTPIILGLLLFFSGPWVTVYLENLTGETTPSNFTGLGITLVGALLLFAAGLQWFCEDEE